MKYVTAITALAYSYKASFHNAYGCLRHTHYQYWLQLPYKSLRIYLTNHMGSISCHITPLVINSLGADTHTCIQTFTDRSNSKKPGMRMPACGRHVPGLKMLNQFLILISSTAKTVFMIICMLSDDLCRCLRSLVNSWTLKFVLTDCSSIFCL